MNVATPLEQIVYGGAESCAGLAKDTEPEAWLWSAGLSSPQAEPIDLAVRPEGRPTTLPEEVGERRKEVESIPKAWDKAREN